ncbi:S8 family peptidase [Rossellomorea marisflavi]|uniref:S8 family peptidase n=1 Tax=Rossellomorea marisflavi TaxID=189381 RepID=UPI000AE32CB0|nr:S8 family serine peptidase [Rossellomorea marisflavi]
MEKIILAIAYSFITFTLIGCSSTGVTTQISESHCKKNWAICSLFPDRQITSDYTPSVKIAVLDSGINKNALGLSEQVTKSFNALDSSSTTSPEFSHGTMIASIIVRNPQAEVNTMIGINSNVELFDVQVLNGKGSGKVEDTIKGIKWSIDQGVDIINISYGFSKENSDLEKVIKLAIDNGIVVVAAVGNTIGLSTDYPAKYPEVISISAIDSLQKKFLYAGKGKVDYVAPGVNVPVLNSDGEIELQSGTSFATAYATGVISLMDQQKEITEIKNILQSNARYLGDSNVYGNGLIQFKE